MLAAEPALAATSCSKTGEMPLHAAVAAGRLPIIKVLKPAAAAAEQERQRLLADTAQERKRQSMEEARSVEEARSRERKAVLEQEWRDALAAANACDALAAGNACHALPAANPASAPAILKDQAHSEPGPAEASHSEVEAEAYAATAEREEVECAVAQQSPGPLLQPTLPAHAGLAPSLSGCSMGASGVSPSVHARLVHVSPSMHAIQGGTSQAIFLKSDQCCDLTY
jgi:hypothetical protein